MILINLMIINLHLFECMCIDWETIYSCQVCVPLAGKHVILEGILEWEIPIQITIKKIVYCFPLEEGLFFFFFGGSILPPKQPLWKGYLGPLPSQWTGWLKRCIRVMGETKAFLCFICLWKALLYKVPL